MDNETDSGTIKIEANGARQVLTGQTQYTYPGEIDHFFTIGGTT